MTFIVKSCYMQRMDLRNQSFSLPQNFFFRLTEDVDPGLNIDWLEKKDSFVDISLRPLYQVFRRLSGEKVGKCLVRCSSRQRQGFLDIDLWEKDHLDIPRFEFWIEAYSQCYDEEVLEEFIKSISFQLYLKSRFNISTFDLEDPHYPEHDNYFLPEDNQLLFEFHESYQYVDEIKKYLRVLYSFMGVENAYAYLMKTVVDTFSYMQEYEYENKKRRLSEYGLLDYYESLEIESCYPNLKTMNIRLKSRTVQNLNTNEVEEQNLKLSRIDLIPFQDYARDIAIEFNKVKDPGRCKYLEFSFVRLINANIVFNGNLSWGNNLLSYKRMIQKTCSFLLLGIDYLKKEGNVDSPFAKFDFIDFYKVGKTLITEGQRPLKKILSQKSNLKNFFGSVWDNFLEESFEGTCHFQGEKVLNYNIYNEWRSWGKGLLELHPFMNELKKTWDKMVEEGKVQDSFYLNYNLDEINFEVILLSGLANHYLYPSRQTTASVKPKFRSDDRGI